MKAAEVVPCIGCGRSPFADKHVTFHVLTLDRAIVDFRAAQSMAGLALQVGHYGIAEALAPDPEIAKLVSSVDPHAKTTVHVCENCAASKTIWELLEAAANRQEESTL